MFQKSESKEFNYPAAMEVFVFASGAIAELASLEPSKDKRSKRTSLS